MALASLPFALLGALLMVHIPTDALRRSLGVMILLYLLISKFDLAPAFKQSNATIITGSAIYGFVSGMLGSGNIIKAVIFREMQLSKQAFVGTMAASAVLSNIAKLTAYTQSDLLGREYTATIIALIVVAIFAALIGSKILRVMPIKHFEVGIQIVLLVSAVGLLL